MPGTDLHWAWDIGRIIKATEQRPFYFEGPLQESVEEKERRLWRLAVEYKTVIYWNKSGLLLPGSLNVSLMWKYDYKIVCGL